MAIEGKYHGVQYVGTFIIPHAKYHQIAVVCEGESGKEYYYVFENFIGKGIMDAENYRINTIPEHWKRIDGEGCIEGVEKCAGG